ncbi:MAG: helix-turn-helix domain-containing protein [Opitutaceae bacterium]|nr:helix-turn-helix domain-containing protein [Opitutaceae bacterium]
MLSSKIKELADYKAKIVELEKAVLEERETALARAHTDLGFASRSDLIKALKALEKAAPKRGRKKGAKPADAKAERKGRRKRTTITPELRDSILAAVKEGGTGAAVAKRFGVSLPTVQNIKRAAGLTRGTGSDKDSGGAAGS